MRKAFNALITLLDGWSAILTILMVAVVLSGVFFRYVVDHALSWYDEFAGYLLVWLTLYGSVVALAHGKHIGFETIKEKFPPRVQRVVDLFGTVCVLGFCVVLAWSGWVLIKAMGAETAISITEVKMAWVYSVLPITGALMVLVCVVQLITAFSRKGAAGGSHFKGMEEGQ